MWSNWVTLVSVNNWRALRQTQCWEHLIIFHQKWYAHLIMTVWMLERASLSIRELASLSISWDSPPHILQHTKWMTCISNGFLQCEGKEYNHKSDIWALGCILYEMASRQKTFEGSNLPALVNKIMKVRYTIIQMRASCSIHCYYLFITNTIVNLVYISSSQLFVKWFMCLDIDSFYANKVGKCYFSV